MKSLRWSMMWIRGFALVCSSVRVVLVWRSLGMVLSRMRGLMRGVRVTGGPIHRDAVSVA